MSLVIPPKDDPEELDLGPSNNDRSLLSVSPCSSCSSLLSRPGPFCAPGETDTSELPYDLGINGDIIFSGSRENPSWAGRNSSPMSSSDVNDGIRIMDRLERGGIASGAEARRSWSFSGASVAAGAGTGEVFERGAKVRVVYVFQYSNSQKKGSGSI